MIRCELYSPRGDWKVHLFCAIDSYWIDEIMEALFYAGVDGSKAKQAYENLNSGNLNSGLCYSNYNKRESVIVISKTSSASELFNSCIHEFAHLAAHIAKADGLDNAGEHVAYCVGDMARDVWGHIGHLFCDCCRKKVYHERTHGEDRGYGVSENGRLTPYLE